MGPFVPSTAIRKNGEKAANDLGLHEGAPFGRGRRATNSRSTMEISCARIYNARVMTNKLIAAQLGTRCVIALLVATLGACAAAQSTRAAPSSVNIEASHEFQRQYDQQLRDDPTSFLTAVAAHYLAPGSATSIIIGPAITLDLQATDEALIVRRGPEQQRFEDSAVLPLDERHTLSISRQELDWRVLVHDRDTPRRASFSGVTWFPVDGRRIVAARYASKSPREPMLLQTSRGVSKTLYVAGEATFELDGAAATLLVFAYSAQPQPGEPLLIPFRDATSGEQTYAAGRYLELEAPTADALVLDFNRATNPLCAYSEHYNCPMPPRFNVLPFAIEAGAAQPQH